MDEVLDMMIIVSKCQKELPPEKNVPHVQTLQQWARDALGKLDEQGLNRNTAALADPMRKPKPPAEPGPGRGHVKAGSETTGFSDRQERGATYLRRRLARDRPELLEQIGPEKPFRSVRAAAIEAGIIKPVAVARLTTPEAIAAKLQQHLSPDDLARIVAILTEALAG